MLLYKIRRLTICDHARNCSQGAASLLNITGGLQTAHKLGILFTHRGVGHVGLSKEKKGRSSRYSSPIFANLIFTFNMRQEQHSARVTRLYGYDRVLQLCRGLTGARASQCSSPLSDSIDGSFHRISVVTAIFRHISQHHRTGQHRNKVTLSQNLNTGNPSLGNTDES
jgi:hypothetical protein